jgi:hypothetical protein
MAYETKEDAVRSRIKALQKEKGLTENGLAEGDTPAQKRLNRQLSHGAAITLDTLLRILDFCPDVSSDWLLRGSGDMFTNNSAVAANKVTGKNATVIGQQATLSEDFVKGLLAEKDRQIQTLLSLLAK